VTDDDIKIPGRIIDKGGHKMVADADGLRRPSELELDLHDTLQRLQSTMDDILTTTYRRGQAHGRAELMAVVEPARPTLTKIAYSAGMVHPDDQRSLDALLDRLDAYDEYRSDRD
jgi:uncharacterized membrane protein YccC